MPTESNAKGDFGPNTPKGVPMRDHKNKQTRLVGPGETPRERMVRVIKAGRKKQKRG